MSAPSPTPDPAPPRPESQPRSKALDPARPFVRLHYAFTRAAVKRYSGTFGNLPHVVYW